MKTKSLLATLIIICAFTCMPSQIFAKDHPDQGTIDCPPPTQAPLDGGLSLLIAAGIGYGVKKAYDKRKKDKSTDNTGNII